MALIIPLGPQVKIGVRIGYAKAPDAVMVVMSLSNAAASVDCDGVNYPITWVATDGEAVPAGYTATVPITGLAEFMEYDYTVTQGANTVTGNFYTLPGPQDDFCFYALTCDGEASVSDGNSDGEGVYKTIKDRVAVDPLPCVGILHIDDHGYTAARSFTSAAAVGLAAANPQTLNTEYAFAAAWLNFYGMHAEGSGDSGFGESTAFTTTANIDIGRSPNRVWCMQNLPVWPQWGDWDFYNDIGMDFPTSDPAGLAGNPFHKTYVGTVGQKDGGGYLAWQKFMAPLQPPLLNATNGNAWAFNLGCIKVIASDGITNCNGAISYYSPNNPDGILLNDTEGVTQVTSMLGSGQVADILAAIDPNMQFTIIGLMNGVRYMGKLNSEFDTGSQHPIKNHCPAEFNALFSSTGSLADKVSTNNTRGITFTFNGDYHNGHVYHHQITDGTLPTDFYEIGLGTCTASYNHGASNVSTPLGADFKGSTIDYLDYSVGGDTGVHKAWGVKVSVYGAKAFKEVVIELFSTTETLWAAKFIGQVGNNKFATDFVVPKLQPQ